MELAEATKSRVRRTNPVCVTVICMLIMPKFLFQQVGPASYSKSKTIIFNCPPNITTSMSSNKLKYTSKAQVLIVSP